MGCTVSSAIFCRTGAGVGRVWIGSSHTCEAVSGHLFLFCNGQRNRLKVLVWEEADSGSVPRG
jgi:hypothetical protein